MSWLRHDGGAGWASVGFTIEISKNHYNCYTQIPDTAGYWPNIANNREAVEHE